MIIEYSKDEIIEQLQILKNYQDDISDNIYNTQFYKHYINKKKSNMYKYSTCLQNQKGYYINIKKEESGNSSIYNNLDSLSSLFENSSYLCNKDVESYDKVENNYNAFQYFDLFYIFDHILTNFNLHISYLKDAFNIDKFKHF